MENKVTEVEAGTKRDFAVRLNAFYIVLGAISSFLWVCIFGFGMLIDSKPYRDKVVSNLDINSFFMCLLAYTPTNIFLLCMVSALAGGCASHLVATGAKKTLKLDGQFEVTDSHIYLTENPFSAMLRGLVVFFSFLAGVFISGSNLILQPTPQGYTQAAGVVSFMAFLVGYDPTIFSSFIKVSDKIKKQ